MNFYQRLPLVPQTFSSAVMVSAASVAANAGTYAFAHLALQNSRCLLF
ncbi:MAG: hypothetical protein K2L12_01145 [Clostridia bacterium]|nr:hypothetical protein [Clostridia bacterium]